MAEPGFVELTIADALEAARQGPDATAHELTLLARPWGFDLRDISVPVHLWQGTTDTNVSRAMGEYLAEVLPNSEATFCPDEGHLVGYTHWPAILGWVTG